MGGGGLEGEIVKGEGGSWGEGISEGRRGTSDRRRGPRGRDS